jgi:hypothetical protein
MAVGELTGFSIKKECIFGEKICGDKRVIVNLACKTIADFAVLLQKYLILCFSLLIRRNVEKIRSEVDIAFMRLNQNVKYFGLRTVIPLRELMLFHESVCKREIKALFTKIFI